MTELSKAAEAQIRKQWENTFETFRMLIIRKAVLKSQGEPTPPEMEAQIEALCVEMDEYKRLLGIE